MALMTHEFRYQHRAFECLISVRNVTCILCVRSFNHLWDLGFSWW